MPLNSTAANSWPWPFPTAPNGKVAVRLFALVKENPGVDPTGVRKLSGWTSDSILPEVWANWLKANGDEIVRDFQTWKGMGWPGAAFTNLVPIGWEYFEDNYYKEYCFEEYAPQVLRAADKGRIVAPVSHTEKIIEAIKREYGKLPAVVKAAAVEKVLPHNDWVEKINKESPGELARRAWEATKSLI